jgi:calcium-dependent protein kinase
MLGQQSDFEDLKLIDFGKNGDKVDCVNSLYNAPEFLDGLYTKKCDTWAIGVLAFNLLSGRFPFDGKPYLQMVSSILKGSIRFPRTDWARISPSAKDFV